MPSSQILFDLRHAHNQTGIGRYARGLAGAFEDIDPSELPEGLGFLVNTTSENWAIPEEPVRSPTLTFREQLELPWRLRDAELLHAPFLNIPLTYRGKLVLTVHDFTLLDFIDSLSTVLHRSYARLMTRLSIKRACRIITVSNHTKSDLVDRYAFPHERIDVVHNGLSSRFKPVEPNKVRERLHELGISRPYVLSLGRNAPHKNFDRLIHAFDILRDSHPELSLVLAGKGMEPDSELGELARELNLQDSMELLGFVAESQMCALYSGAEVFSLVSANEGFGFPPLEAMACHTPCVVSDISSLPEITGDAALHVDPDNVRDIANAIDAVLEDPELSSDLVSRGATRAEEFSWKQCAEETLETYRKALDNP